MKGLTYRHISGVLIILFLSMLTGCSIISESNDQYSLSRSQPSKPRTYVFECDDTYTFVARQENKSIWLFLPYKTVNLPQTTTDSGLMFSNGQISFWLDTEKAKLKSGNRLYDNCLNNRARAIWEHAKLNGVDFRAVGNEPGWYLEIYEGNKIRFVADYGKVRYKDINLPDPQIIPNTHKTVYTFVIDEHVLEISIEAKLCRDTMVDEQYENTVIVNLDDKKYIGCGRPLH